MSGQKEEKLVENNPNEQLSPAFPAFRSQIFFIFITLSIVMSGDNGVLSSNKKQVGRNIFNQDFWKFASAGRILGNVVFIGLHQTDRRKIYTLVYIFINGAPLFA